MLFILSWRNIWRNKKRTIIVAASVFFAVILASIMRSAQLGSYAFMIDSTTKMQTGYLQIQGKGYWDNRSLDKSFSLSAGLLDSLSKIPYLSNQVPRLEAFALISKDSLTKVSPVVGIDPLAEARMTGLPERLVAGEYFDSNSSGVIIAEGLAKRLSVSVGDSLVLYGSGFHGQIAAARLPVIGMVHLPLPLLNKAMIYLPLGEAQYIFLMPQRITSLSLMIDHIKHLETVYPEVTALAGSNLTVMRWNEMMPEIEQSIEVDSAQGVIMLLILYVVIGLGVFGTIMMMTAERERELGILNAVGMKKSVMIGMAVLECIQVCFLGVFAGMLVSIPVANYMRLNPIRLTGENAEVIESFGMEPMMYFSSDPQIFLIQALVVLLIAVVCSLYPLFFISRLEPVAAIRK